MSDLNKLEAETLEAIASASDEAALEAVRVGALGKKGSISALLATLGKMSPDERKTAGAAINALKDKVSDALGARRVVLKEAALEARLASERVDVTLPMAFGDDLAVVRASLLGHVRNGDGEKGVCGIHGRMGSKTLSKALS